MDKPGYDRTVRKFLKLTSHHTEELQVPMDTLSRREEDTLLKATKARALKDCDDIVKDFAECATGRTISVAWACRDQYKNVQNCMLRYTGPEAMDLVRKEYLRLRNPQQQTAADVSS